MAYSSDSKTLLSELKKHWSIHDISMFGCIGLFNENNTIFGLLHDGKFYVRSTTTNEPEYIRRGYQPYIYEKRSTSSNKPAHNVRMHYYHIDMTNGIDSRFVSLVNSTITELEQHSTEPKQKIRQLPNMRVSLERKLVKVGIDTVSKLKAVGSIKAFIKLKEQTPTMTSNVLLALEGAITNTHAAVLPQARRKELIQLAGVQQKQSANA